MHYAKTYVYVEWIWSVCFVAKGENPKNWGEFVQTVIYSISLYYNEVQTVQGKKELMECI